MQQHLGNGWLTDKHIRAAQTLLREKFPGISGLQDTCIVSAYQGCVMALERVQIHHLHNHWLCASTVGTPNGIVRIYMYDSFNQSRPSAVLLKQLASILQPSTSTLTVEVIECQLQRNVDDCGLFAVANAAAQCERVSRHWEQDMMQAHLLSCFEAEIFSPFPGE